MRKLFKLVLVLLNICEKIRFRAITGIALTMLLIGVLMLAFNIEGRYALAGNAHIWHTETVDSDGDVGQYSSIALDKSGTPHISYFDGSSGYLKYAYYDNNESKWLTEIVDNSGFE